MIRIALMPFGGATPPHAREHLDIDGARPVDLTDDLDAVLVLGTGEPHRERLDDLIRHNVPHLVLRFFPDEVLLGPLVSPSETACLRCVDAHHLESHGNWPFLVAGVAATDRKHVVHPTPPGLTALALDWAVWDLLAHSRGQRPATWSTEIVLPAATSELEAVSWRRHPECGCGWNPPRLSEVRVSH